MEAVPYRFGNLYYERTGVIQKLTIKDRFNKELTFLPAFYFLLLFFVDITQRKM